MNQLPPWLVEHLQQTGKLNPDGFGRYARAGRCHECSALVLRGLDEEVCALAVTVDLDPTTPLGEFLALAAGRTTYSLIREGGSWQLNRRSPINIAAQKADTPVLAAHRCEAAKLPTAAQPNVSRRRPTTPIDDEPPF